MSTKSKVYSKCLFLHREDEAKSDFKVLSKEEANLYITARLHQAKTGIHQSLLEPETSLPYFRSSKIWQGNNKLNPFNINGMNITQDPRYSGQITGK